jgi:hypothetical protein
VAGHARISAAQALIAVLRASGDNLTRENVIQQAASILQRMVSVDEKI